MRSDHLSVSDDALGVYSFKVFIDSGKLKIGVMRNEYSEVTMIKVYRDYRINQVPRICESETSLLYILQGIGNIATAQY